MSKEGQGLKERNYASGPGAAIQGEPLTVPHAAVRPNGYNYNQQSPAVFNKLVESMRQFGFTLPIIVRQLRKNAYEIIDGEHRWRAARELAMPDVRIINLGTVSDEKAKQLTIILNELGGSPDQVRLADLLRDINSNVDFGALAKVMPFAEKELAAYIDSVDFSFASLSDEDTRPKLEQEAPPIPEEEKSESAADEDVRGGQGGVRNARLILAMPPADAAELEAKLVRIADDPVVAVQRAVDAYLAEMARLASPKKAKKA